MLRNALPLLSALLIAGGAAAAAPLALDAVPRAPAEAGSVLRDLSLPALRADGPRADDRARHDADAGEVPRRRDRAGRRRGEGAPDARGPRGPRRDGPPARGHHKGKGKGHAKARGAGHHKHGCADDGAPEADH